MSRNLRCTECDYILDADPIDEHTQFQDVLCDDCKELKTLQAERDAALARVKELEASNTCPRCSNPQFLALLDRIPKLEAVAEAARLFDGTVDGDYRLQEALAVLGEK